MTSPAPDPADAIRVERGKPTDEELAALALVLMARSCGAPDEFDEEEARHCPTAPWQVPGHRVARSWRADPAAARRS
ncbi:acyl-CoA carboxylase epsilon subunit [Streptomyces cylindrosporus]|uniref:Acyl-CoA carboxylase subunit epsilon n=1 Tax=Streptomyces cylindrosporus TaxID=2927583 RepID=A0ABS9YP33_9ACTN|nr:acyl-CoA carboxylase epsilon subunit [Streptomyces cylindrosporus]MCI3278972.1 acyl-CoA carboxylase subunit epsilon [Streptomyces cylindrosporus]